MKRVVSLSVYSRLIFVTAVVAVMVGGSTFAALQTQDVLNKGKAMQACQDSQASSQHSVSGVTGG